MTGTAPWVPGWHLQTCLSLHLCVLLNAGQVLVGPEPETRPDTGPALRSDGPTHRMGKPAALMWMVSTRPQASSWLSTCKGGRQGGAYSMGPAGRTRASLCGPASRTCRVSGGSAGRGTVSEAVRN